MGAQMDIRQNIQPDFVGVKRDQNGLGPAIIGWCGSDKPLRHVPDAAQRLEYRLGAPVTAAAEPDPLGIVAQAASSRFGSFQLGRGEWQV